MTVLFVSLCSLNDNASVTISNVGIIRGLIDCGHNVFIIAPQKNKQAKNYDTTIKNIKEAKHIVIQNNIYYDKIVSGLNSNFKTYLLAFLRFIYHKVMLYDNTYKLIKSASLNEIEDKYFDVIISTSDPKTSHLYVDKLIKLGVKYGKWIQHWGDPMSIDITNSTIYPRGIIRLIERKILKKADKIIYVSPITNEVQKRIFPGLSKIMDYTPLPYDKELIYPKIDNKLPKFGYFGSYSSEIRNISPLLDYFKTNNNLKLVIAGNGDKEITNTDNITYYKRVSRDKVKELESTCDVLICICNSRGTQIPGKIYYYAATNRPILVILDGEYSEYIRSFFDKYNRFIFCENKQKNIEEGIFTILTNKKEYLPIRDFSSKNVVEKIIGDNTILPILN